MADTAYTIREFCDLYKLSLSTFYRLVRAGNAPARIKVGRKTIILKQSAEAWANEQLAAVA